jgi:hypothetical protein
MPWRRSGKDPDSGTPSRGTQMKFEEFKESKEYEEFKERSQNPGVRRFVGVLARRNSVA